ncbi:unnamed protein product [Notodromas monacha]|uniref:Amidinotransferase n=1 Tax=Notodromas monacha TaxID=399045 RepID=A0A7R9BN56_9CRUS|nr:unnamed protein product [Notodromas monacha]CAG0917489.1 unnamed protein product [Notodromas monacha]
MGVFSTVRSVAQMAKNFAVLPRATKLLVVNPKHFDVKYVINPHMEGKIGTVDFAKAAAQWRDLKGIYEKLGFDVYEFDGAQGFPDMVYSANHGLSFRGADEGKSVKEVFMSNMGTEQRRGEVPFFEEWYKKQGYKIHHLPNDLKFEGMGDALWHGSRKLLWGGHGFRSSPKTYEIISNAWNVPIITLELLDPDFYHIDTCLSILDNDTALVFPGAFTVEGNEIIRSVFSKVIEAPEQEARRNMACNAFCPDEKNVIIQAGSEVTNERLEKAGFTVVPVDTTEFMKGGGSVFCMKMFTW